MNELHIGPALLTAIQAYRAALLLYLPDPNDKVAVAITPVPVHLADLIRLCRVTVEHLMNAKGTANEERE